MPLYNAASRARNTGQLVNRNTGGGSKKAGFPYMVGRGYLSSIYLNGNGPVSGKCCKIDIMNQVMRGSSISRPIGRTGNSVYWHIPGTGPF